MLESYTAAEPFFLEPNRLACADLIALFSVWSGWLVG
jgi:hypothetical protein